MTRKVVTIAAILLIAALATLGLYSRLSGKPNPNASAKELHRIDMFASVKSMTSDQGWTVSGGVTAGGALRMNLDDGRTLVISEGTHVDTKPPTEACADFVAPNACVVAADMLGDAVVWFSLVKADTSNGLAQLTLPGLVDMEKGGDWGILDSGWIVKLATPTIRDCGDTETTSLKDFINRFPNTASSAIVNLTLDSVTKVKCASNPAG